MKKILTLVAALAVAAGFLFTSCKKDTNTVKEFSYSISIDFKSISWTGDVTGGGSDDTVKIWSELLESTVRSAFGTNTDTFTLKGTEAACDAQVLATCKLLEPALAKIKGGEATISIKNETTKKTVWSYNVTQ